MREREPRSLKGVEDLMEREFICVPVRKWKLNAVLQRSSEDAIAIFKEIAEETDAEWRMQVVAGQHAFSVRQCFKVPERFRRWTEQRIDRALGELRARGCLELASANDREWLQIPEQLQYRKGHREASALVPLVQPELMMGPMLFEEETGRVNRKEHKDHKEGETGNGRGVPLAGIGIREEKIRGETEDPSPPRESGEYLLTESEAVALAANQGVPEAFARSVYGSWYSRQGRDGAGVCVRFPRYLSSRWARESTDWKAGIHRNDPQRKTKNGTHSGSRGQIRDRNAGTANEGKSSEYAAIGEI